MDEFQFIESLDALLANDGIDETETVDATGEMANHVNVNHYNPVYDQDPFAQFFPTTRTTAMPSPQVAENFYPQQYTSLVNNSTMTYSNIHVEQQPAGTGMLSPAAVLSRQIPTSSALGMEVATVQAPSMTTVAPPSGATTMSFCSVNSGTSKRTTGISTSGGRSVCSATSAGTGGTSSSRKRSRQKGSSSMAVSDSEDEGSKRRSDRNLREQKRSQKITEQIDQLREVLAAASVRFKPDKFSTLISVVEYVKQLQTRSTMLDTEHKNLVDTISRTNEMVNESYLPASATGGGGSSHSSDNKTDCDTSLNAQPDSAVSSGSDIYNDDEMVFVRNVDYRCIFDRCGVPLAVASIDGRLLDCNDEFLKLTQYSRKELLPIEYHQQASAVIADEVASSFSEDPSAFPDVPASNNNLSIIGSRTDDESNSVVTTETTTTSRIYLKQDQGVQQDGGDDDKESTKDDDSQIPTRNFSLFDLLSRNHMEEVFVSLSQMLKRPPKDKVGTGAVTMDDHWWGNVHLNRNTDLEVRHIIF
jgi:PAS domain-containing protein